MQNAWAARSVPDTAVLALALRAPVLVFVFVQDQLVLELVHGAASFVYEPAQVPGHLRKLAGTEDDQEQEPYEHHLLDADAEHEA